jgi:hypothetical protein
MLEKKNHKHENEMRCHSIRRRCVQSMKCQ